MFCPIIYIYIQYIVLYYLSVVLFQFVFLCLCFLLLIPERVRCQWYLGDDGATAEHPKFILNMFEAHRIADSQICLVVLISMLVWCIYIYMWFVAISTCTPPNPTTAWTDYGNQNHWPHPYVQSEKYQKQNHMFIDHSFFWSLKFYIVHVHYM